ncbi:hypothetical protein EH31_07305 [Erythrobacter longus]|uniref:Uncharacterized protein n=1 Tax=Erythrobacter longus TaxID=1044 RepID=A0A074M7U6_ERYLO|nr:hypothetical protein [Erythrobacter longus]KEO90836.1 hypothetical protein EH31_07305 [Erythrobacter longus]
MGLPSLLEDIVQKRIDNFLKGEIDAGQFYTREDFKRAIAQLGINAKNLLAVDDKELVEISEEFAKDVTRIRSKNEKLVERLNDQSIELKEVQKTLATVQSRVGALSTALKNAEKENSSRRVEANKLKRLLLEAETEKRRYHKEVQSLKGEREKLHEAIMKKLVDQ